MRDRESRGREWVSSRRGALGSEVIDEAVFYIVYRVLVDLSCL